MKKKFWIFIFGLYALFALCSCFKSSNVSSTKDKYIEAPSWIKFDSFKGKISWNECVGATQYNIYLNDKLIHRIGSAEHFFHEDGAYWYSNSITEKMTSNFKVTIESCNEYTSNQMSKKFYYKDGIDEELIILDSKNSSLILNDIEFATGYRIICNGMSEVVSSNIISLPTNANEIYVTPINDYHDDWFFKTLKYKYAKDIAPSNLYFDAKLSTLNWSGFSSQYVITIDDGISSKEYVTNEKSYKLNIATLPVNISVKGFSENFISSDSTSITISNSNSITNLSLKDNILSFEKNDYAQCKYEFYQEDTLIVEGYTSKDTLDLNEIEELKTLTGLVKLKLVTILDNYMDLNPSEYDLYFASDFDFEVLDDGNNASTSNLVVKDLQDFVKEVKIDIKTSDNQLNTIEVLNNNNSELVISDYKFEKATKYNVMISRFFDESKLVVDFYGIKAKNYTKNEAPVILGASSSYDGCKICVKVPIPNRYETNKEYIIHINGIEEKETYKPSSYGNIYFDVPDIYANSDEEIEFLFTIYEKASGYNLQSLIATQNFKKLKKVELECDGRTLKWDKQYDYYKIINPYTGEIIANKIEDNSYEISLKEGKNYFSIFAVGGIESYMIESNISNTIMLEKMYSPTLSVDNGLISWQKYENAKFKIEIDDEVLFATESSIDLAPFFTEKSEIDFSICALPTISSDDIFESEVLEYRIHKFDSIKGLSLSNTDRKLSWDEINYANEYDVVIENSIDNSFVSLSVSQNEINLDDVITYGKYQFKIAPKEYVENQNSIICINLDGALRKNICSNKIISVAGRSGYSSFLIDRIAYFSYTSYVRGKIDDVIIMDESKNMAVDLSQFEAGEYQVLFEFAYDIERLDNDFTLVEEPYYFDIKVEKNESPKIYYESSSYTPGNFNVTTGLKILGSIIVKTVHELKLNQKFNYYLNDKLRFTTSSKTIPIDIFDGDCVFGLQVKSDIFIDGVYVKSSDITRRSITIKPYIEQITINNIRIYSDYAILEFKVSSEKTYCNVYLNNVFIDRDSCSSKSWKLRIDEALKSGDVIKLEMYILSGDYSNPKRIYNSPYSFIEITI